MVHVVHHLGDGGMSVSSRHIFRLTPTTSHAENRPRPTIYATLSKHSKFVVMLLLSPKKGFWIVNRSRGTPGCELCALLNLVSYKVGFTKIISVR